MSRCIDADALIADCQLAQKQADRHGREFANAFYSGGGEVSTEWWCVEDMIENAPTIEPRKKGMWLPDNNSLYEMRFVCSECHESEVVPTIGFTKYKPIWNFCPNCGADMREPEDIPMEYFESGGR